MSTEPSLSASPPHNSRDDNLSSYYPHALPRCSRIDVGRIDDEQIDDQWIDDDRIDDDERLAQVSSTAESMFWRRADGELVELLNLFDNSDQIQFILTPFDELQFT